MRWVARILRRLAGLLDPDEVSAPVPISALDRSDDEIDLRRVQLMCDEIELRGALDQALNRFSPRRLPAKA